MSTSTEVGSHYATKANAAQRKEIVGGAEMSPPGEQGGAGDVINSHRTDDEDNEDGDDDDFVPKGPLARPTRPPTQQSGASRPGKPVTTSNQTAPEPTPATEQAAGETGIHSSKVDKGIFSRLRCGCIVM